MSVEKDNEPIPIPHWFLRDIAPRIREMNELQVMLACFRLQEGAGDCSRPICELQLLRDAPLHEALQLDGAVQPPDDSIKRGIELAVARDSLLQFRVERQDGSARNWLLIATSANRLRLDQYRTGELEAPADPESGDRAGTVVRERPGVFRMYEQNIGLVTPIIADRLVEALELYPQAWIEDAIETSVSYNRRNWRYIQRILETWATEGRGNETNRRHQSSTGDLDPERHLSGEYAAIFRRRRGE